MVEIIIVFFLLHWSDVVLEAIQIPDVLALLALAVILVLWLVADIVVRLQVHGCSCYDSLNRSFEVVGLRQLLPRLRSCQPSLVFIDRPACWVYVFSAVFWRNMRLFYAFLYCFYCGQHITWENFRERLEIIEFALLIIMYYDWLGSDRLLRLDMIVILYLISIITGLNAIHILLPLSFLVLYASLEFFEISFVLLIYHLRIKKLIQKQIN